MKVNNSNRAAKKMGILAVIALPDMHARESQKIIAEKLIYPENTSSITAHDK